jgi:hypothetical protein
LDKTTILNTSSNNRSAAMPPVRQNGHRRQTSSEFSRAPPSRLEGIRTGVNHLFSGRSRVGTPRSRTPESPKTPRLALGLGNFSSTRLVIPYLTRTNATPPSPARHDPHSPISSRPITADSLRQQTTILPTSQVPPHVRHNSHSARRFVGVDPAELHLANLAESGRRRRRNKARQREPRCAPKIKNKKIRAKILSCFISGLVSSPLSLEAITLT